MKAVERARRIEPSVSQIGSPGGKRRNHHQEPGPRGGHHPPDQELVAIYQQQTQEHRLLQRKADRAQAALKTAQKIFKELLADPEFVSLLRSEGKGTAPRFLLEGVSDVEMVQ
ncbi:hypothetical protein [Rhizobacter sp. P5_C2]